MRKSFVKYIKSVLIISTVMIFLTGCDKLKQQKEPEIGVITTEKDNLQNDIQSDSDSLPENVNDGIDELSENVYDDSESMQEDVIAKEGDLLEYAITDEENSTEDVFVDEGSLTEDVVVDASLQEETTGGSTIVWLGDSLTQGSLGHDSDNLANAPYIKLAALSGRVIEGYGYYGYNTHDIFWVYVDENHENQRKDPAKTYVFWVGSNDWVVDGKTNDNAEAVIAEIDSFVSGGNITKYIVLSTTARYELRADYPSNDGKDMHQLINDKLQKHYGEKYLDVNSVIGIDDGYGPDNIHLTQKSYDDVAKLVDEKIRQMGW